MEESLRPQESEAMEVSKQASFPCQEEAGTCQADAAVQTSAFKKAIEGRGPAIGKCMLS